MLLTFGHHEVEAEAVYQATTEHWNTALVLPKGQHHEEVIDCRAGEQCHRVYGPDDKLVAVLRRKDGSARLTLAFGGLADLAPPLVWLPQNWLLFVQREASYWVYTGRGEDGPAYVEEYDGATYATT